MCQDSSTVRRGLVSGRGASVGECECECECESEGEGEGAGEFG